MNRRLVLAVSIALAALIPTPCRSSVSVEDEEVVFTLGGVHAEKVFLTGDFNAWNATIDLMVEGEAGFEIRLYLLPGKYRYRFMADGVSMHDPDNPCLDAEGNSCFTLVDRNGALAIVLGEPALPKSGSSGTRVVPSARINAVATEGAASIFSEGGMRGTIDEAIDVDLSIGATGELLDGERVKGRSFLLRGLAAYRSERGALLAFERSPRELEPGDPIGLIGQIGPYRYPLSLFARGVQYEGTLPLGFRAWFLFASRISGYRSGLESSTDSADVFSGRDRLDSDVWALKLGGNVGKAVVRYLYRQDRRPREGTWQAVAFGSDLYRGFERDAFQGVWLSLPGDRGVTFDGELLFGRSFLSATGRLDEGSGTFREVSREAEWERGARLSAGISRSGDGLRAKLLFAQTTLEGDRRMRGGRPDGSRTSLAGALGFDAPVLSIGFEGKIEQYSLLNTGSTFWLARTNFWLDGDELGPGFIPFLASREIYEAKISCAWNQEQPGELPWGSGLRLEMTQRGEGSGGGSLYREIRLASGIAVHPRLTFLLDMRGASYAYRSTERDFIDAYLAVRGEITKFLWCSLGTGVNPFAFDRWRYAFSNHGREDYVLDRGVFRALAAYGEEASMKALIEAEEAMADDWAVTFEAGFTF